MSTLPQSSPSPSPPRLPRRDATARPPAALCPLFDALDAYGAPIGAEDLLREITRFPLSSADLGDAIMIDIGAYVRTLVRASPHYEVLVMAWLPGQRSPIHDHAGSRCCVRIVSGCATETTFALQPNGRARAETTRGYTPGNVVCSEDADIHTLGNAVTGCAAPSDILVTLHVYSPPLAATRKYDAAEPDSAAA